MNKNKKIILEMIMIFVALAYLLNMFFNKFPKSAEIFLPITIFFTGLEFMIKYIKEVNFYKNKYNLLKLSVSIYSIYLMFLSFCYIINKLNPMFIKIYITSIALYSIFVIYYAIYHIINILKNKKDLFKNVVRSFFALLSLTFIMICFVKVLQFMI